MSNVNSWARVVRIVVTAGEGFRLVLDVAGEEVETPQLSPERGTQLAFAMLALAAVDEAAAVTLPSLGEVRLGNLADAGAMLLAFYPGPLAKDGLIGLLGIVT